MSRGSVGWFDENTLYQHSITISIEDTRSRAFDHDREVRAQKKLQEALEEALDDRSFF